jgi:hypothetical protein
VHDGQRAAGPTAVPRNGQRSSSAGPETLPTHAVAAALTAYRDLGRQMVAGLVERALCGDTPEKSRRAAFAVLALGAFHAGAGLARMIRGIAPVRKLWLKLGYLASSRRTAGPNRSPISR